MYESVWRTNRGSCLALPWGEATPGRNKHKATQTERISRIQRIYTKHANTLTTLLLLSPSLFLSSFFLQAGKSLWHIILMFIVFYCQANYFWYCAAGHRVYWAKVPSSSLLRSASAAEGSKPVREGRRKLRLFPTLRHTHTFLVIWLALRRQAKNHNKHKENADIIGQSQNNLMPE